MPRNATRSRSRDRQNEEEQPTTAIVVANPIQAVDELMSKKRDQLLDLFGHDEAVVDRLRTLTLHALATPKLLEKLRQADIATVMEAIRQCASLGLMPIPALAEGYFVPYWNNSKRAYDIQFQPGYQGLAKLVLNSGRVLDVDAGVAYANDRFEYEEGSDPFVRHVRALSERGDRVAAYAVARLPGGLKKVRVLTIAEVEQHRKASKQGDSGPWVDWYDPMAMKSAFRELQKYLPKSATVERALLLEAEAEETYSAPPTARTVLVSDARRRLRSRFNGEEPNGSPPPEIQAATTPDAGAATDTAPEGDPPVSGDPRADSGPDGPEDVVEGEVTAAPDDGRCGERAPVDLGFAEGTTCVLRAGHSFPDGKPNAHQNEEGSRWPNR